MDLQLAGKNVLVTGAGQGVGRRVAEAFVAEGANVAFAHHSSGQGAEEGAAAARAATQQGVPARALLLDERSASSLRTPQAYAVFLALPVGMALILARIAILLLVGRMPFAGDTMTPGER